MSNSLSIRSYPSRRIKILPVTCSVGAFGYYLVCLLPVAMICFFMVALWGSRQRQSWISMGLGFSILGLVIAVTYLRRLRLEITPEGIAYRSLFRGTRFVAFHEISTIVLISPARAYLKNPETEGPSRDRKLVVTPKPETGKSSIRIPVILFDPTAEDKIVRLLEPDVWGS
jgi:hypothetical protein